MLIQKECSDTDDSNIVSNETVEQPSEDTNSNEDNEEIVTSQNDTNLKETTREQFNHYVEKGASLDQRFHRDDSRTCVDSNIFCLLSNQFRRSSAHFSLIYQ